jgi:type VI secretion system protein ImpE
MSAEELLRTGQLTEALSALQQQVRAHPADAKLRVFLFQLLCVLGQWNRAMTQLNVAGELDASTLLMVQTYREALRCEVYRAEVFAGRRSPMILGDPETWMALLLQSLNLTAAGRCQEAAEVRGQALEQAPTSPGKMDGAAFEWLADADSRLGPCLELIMSGRYYWVPVQRVRAIRIEAPADLRDFVWAPAQLTWVNGGEAVALIPRRYPGTEQCEDNALKMGRRTDWVVQPGELYCGIGQRLMATDTGESALLDIRSIDFDPVPAGGDG